MTAQAAPQTEEAEVYEFDEEFQRKIAALVLRDTAFLSRTNGLIKPDYFENEALASVVGAALDHYHTYRSAPDPATIGQMLKKAFASKRIRSDMIQEVKDTVRELLKESIADGEFVGDECAAFAKHQALQNAILKSVGALEKGDFDKINDLVTQASQVGITETNNEYDYWEEVEARTTKRKALAAGTLKPNGITTGCPDLDKRLYHHGWGRKELSLLMGAAKAGKSMGLGHFAMAANLDGKNVLYVTLENSSEISSDRFDANVANIAVNLLKDKPVDTDTELKKAQKRAGKLKILEYPTGTLKPSALRRAVHQYRAKGIIFDLIVVDYADIMAPERYTGDLKEDMRMIYIMLRALAVEENAAVLTATQTNREGAKAAVAKMTDVAEDFNKIRTADLVLSINSTEQERQAGEARIFFAACRNVRDQYSLRVQQDRSTMRFLKKVLGEE